MTATSDPILDLVSAMNRAKVRGTTDDDQALLDKQLAYCYRYWAFVDAEIERDPETTNIDSVLKFHMMTIACGFWKSGLPHATALLTGLALGTYFLEQIHEAYKDESK